MSLLTYRNAIEQQEDWITKFEEWGNEAIMNSEEMTETEKEAAMVEQRVWISTCHKRLDDLKPEAIAEAMRYSTPSVVIVEPEQRVQQQRVQHQQQMQQYRREEDFCRLLTILVVVSGMLVVLAGTLILVLLKHE